MESNERKVKVLDVNIDKCRNCYKCVRSCEVKAINIMQHHVHVDDDRCIMCGRCIKACAVKSRYYVSDYKKVLEFLKNGDKIVLSVSPTWLGVVHPIKGGQFVAALKELGFYAVREAAEGSVYVTREYQKLIHEGKMTNIITTDCPSAVELIEKHYPQLVPYLAPVESPMIAHGRLLRRIYGEDVKVVYLGSCIAEKDEAFNDERVEGIYDAVITFSEVRTLMKIHHIDPKQMPEKSFDNPDPGVNRLYAVRGGVIESVNAGMENEDDNDRYMKYYVHGMDDTRDMLDTMVAGNIKNSFIELHICRGSCVHGTAPNSASSITYGMKIFYNEHVNKNVPSYEDFPEEFDISKRFYSHQNLEPMPSEEEIEDVLHKTGKRNKSDELNCGACGYNTCRERAIAVVRGKTELNMCIPYLRERTESLSNLILDSTPDMIILTDKEMRIQEFNRAAEDVFGISRAAAVGMKLSELIPSEDFENVAESGEAIYGNKVIYGKYNVVTQQTIVYMENQEMVLGLFRDITSQEIKRQQNAKVKKETIELARDVIEKQMSTAQMIAGLLGETTANTKVTLDKLRDMLIDDG